MLLRIERLLRMTQLWLGHLPSVNHISAGFAHAESMPNLSQILRLLPEAPPQDRIDPVPAMRRELSFLRIELERLRALENEARKTNELLVGYIDHGDAPDCVEVGEAGVAVRDAMRHLTWPTETGLHGWACKIRTQKRRRKLSL